MDNKLRATKNQANTGIKKK